MSRHSRAANRQVRETQVQNVQAPAPAAVKAGTSTKAQGSEIYAGGISSGFRGSVMGRITPLLVLQYEQNAILADPVKNIKRLMFKDEPVYTVFDADGEEDPDLSQTMTRIGESLNVYAKEQWCYNDRVFGGCSVFTFGWEKKAVKVGPRTIQMTIPVECKHLPWDSFWQQPAGYLTTYNPIMPGIVVDRELKVHVFQVVDQFVDVQALGGTPAGWSLIEIAAKHPGGETCFKIIKDPSSPDPAGSPECLPLIPLVTAYDHANQADNQRMNRVGAPSIFLRVDELTADNVEYMKAFTQKWGKDTGFFLPNKGWDMVNPYITDTQTAMERMKFIKMLIDSFFNPSTPLADTTGASALGRSDAGASEMFNGSLNNTLSWIEDGFEDIFDEILKINGYEGYHCDISSTRIASKNDTQINADLRLLSDKGAISKNELRQSTPSIQFPVKEDDPTFDEPIAAGGSNQNPFGQTGAFSSPFPVGNVQSPVERTEVLTQTERELLAATRQCKADVMRIVKEQANGSTP